jgi:anti-anti-sigma factor
MTAQDGPDTIDPPDFDATLVASNGTLFVGGELDENACEELRPRLDALMLLPLTVVTVDLQAVTYIGSAAIGMLARARLSGQRMGVNIRIVTDATSHVSALLRTTGITFEGQ